MRSRRASRCLSPETSERGAIGGRQGDEVVVSRIFRADGGRLRRIIDAGRSCGEQAHRSGGVLRADVSPKLRIGEGAFELGEEHRRHDHLDTAFLPGRQQAGRSTGAREQARDDDVRVQDCAHASVAAARRVLRLDRDIRRLRFGELGGLPSPFEIVEPELATERFLDDFAVATTGPSRADLHRLENGVVNCEGGPNLCHYCILCVARQATAGVTSVWLKSSPLNSSGRSAALASA